MDHALDAIQPLSKGHLDMIRRDVDLVVEDALKHKDPEIAFTYGQKLNETGQAVWVAVASVNPALALREVLGEVRLAIENFAMELKKREI